MVLIGEGSGCRLANITIAAWTRDYRRTSAVAQVLRADCPAMEACISTFRVYRPSLAAG